MDNHIMYYTCAKGTLELRRCLLCTKVIFAKQCECELGFDCNREECDKYLPVGRAGTVQRLELLMQLSQ